MTIVNYQTVNCTKRILFVRSSEPSKLFVLIFFRRQIIKMLLNLWFLIGRFHMAIAAQHNIYTYVSGYLNSFWAVSKINYDLRNVRFALFRFFVFFFLMVYELYQNSFISVMCPSRMLNLLDSLRNHSVRYDGNYYYHVISFCGSICGWVGEENDVHRHDYFFIDVFLYRPTERFIAESI